MEKKNCANKPAIIECFLFKKTILLKFIVCSVEVYDEHALSETNCEVID